MEININISLPSAICDLACKLNGEIRQIEPTEIIFAADSPHIPHITLAMGELRSDVSITMIRDSVSTALRDVAPFEVFTKPPHLAQPRNKFVFLGIGPATQIFPLKTLVYESLKGLLHIPPYGRPTAEPHITVGYIEHSQENVSRALSAAYCEARGVFSQIRVARRGQRGTAIEELHTITLKDPTKPCTPTK